MAAPLRILITGFGPFPGAPVNPTQALVARLTVLRRPAFADIVRIAHIFPVCYGAVDRELPQLLARHRPDALLMFGLASRTTFVRVESRARNAVTMLWPDAEHTRVRQAAIVRGAGAQAFGPHTHHLLRAALRTGLDVRASRDAGRYLCNYLGWRGIEAARTPGGPALATFVHVPLLARDTASRRMTLQELTLAGEALLRETVRLARAARHKA
ncbi:pyroglutamyl-peptidase I [Tardiphaga sp.]|uniref:pyroglutamyl-peptidase I n=1 Tax=Tardiphaga sp. TaxID=1926292 RepID=UPI002628FE65|nr:pyroglutamyl-peptidase I [Tardiphaga sp.]MDB5619174.1 peptidase pyroglutamyl peptidase [Tardiphaga sp.]